MDPQNNPPGQPNMPPPAGPTPGPAPDSPAPMPGPTAPPAGPSPQPGKGGGSHMMKWVWYGVGALVIIVILWMLVG